MKHGIWRIFIVPKFAFQGLRYLWAEEAFRHELALGLIGWGILYYVGADKIDLIVFSFLVLAMFSAEAFNTALERIADKIDPSTNPFTKEVKDLGALGVFFWIVMALLWWGCALLKAI